jgi:dTDP-4-dehydrorhamnose reductase
MNILIFGKDGQLGKAFKEVLGSKNLEMQNHIQYVGRAQCDLSNEGAITVLLQHTKPSLIINCAAYTAVDQAESEVELAFAINTKAPETMARYAQERGATFLHYSTDYVFDGTKVSQYKETDQRNPLGIYGKSKAAGEEAIENVFKYQHNIQAKFAILRTSWVYGDGGGTSFAPFCV